MSDAPITMEDGIDATNLAGSAEVARRILDDVAQLVPRFRERATETERLGRVPDISIRELADAGVFRMALPVEYGGFALDPSQIYPVFSEIARGCGSTGWVAWLTTTGVHPVTIYPHQFQQELFRSGWDGPLQSGAINNFAPGLGRRVAGGLMIRGKWAWCSGCHHTRFHILSVMVETDDGGRESVTCQVPHEQIEIIDDWDVMGMQGSGSNSISIAEEIFVPDHRILKTAALFAGIRAAPEPAGLLYKVSFAQLGPITIASLAVGLARAAIEELQRRATGRSITFTTYADQLQAPITHLQLAEMWAKLNACEATLKHSAEQVEGNARDGIPPTPLAVAKLRAATALICMTAKEIADLALRAGGASSIYRHSPLQRIMRDATTLSLHAQTNIETAYEDLGRQMAGLPGFASPRPKTI
ncbi:acyl-CoA dehydrogenase family protein [Novosphingobium sp. KN65.2]|uniref:acyl-CoA dehydrogenase family protein n=1 Tax=Novosphingobium sp. KN65.2 TaxID=1478134 RepID=UPI000A9E5EB7|nr:acyl-CoA dehydrogenase family protein [Novosphingobium sp. KN65.2]